MNFTSKATTFLLICFLLSLSSLSQNLKGSVLENETEKLEDTLNINDGPYVFIESDKLIDKRIVDGKVQVKELPLNAFQTEFISESSVFKTNSRIVALSDIHGQFDLAIEILKNNHVITNDLNWNLNNGHLVIVGDIFDRGPKVTETLWFLYHLEKQAEKSGGKVHVLLGNHEYMVLHKDLRYIHKKYQLTSQLLETNYTDLFSNQTVLGRWLRSKPTVLKINKDTYVHGGLSKTFLDLGYNIENVNKLMRESIDISKEQLKATSFYEDYYRSKGPIWYRGYFNDNLTDSEITAILRQADSEHIIVGHCSNEEVVQLYNQKIFGVDSSIKNGLYGEVLLIDGKIYKRGTKEGNEMFFEIKDEYIIKSE
ncbi:metallophosphoesterase [Xanthomarina sp. GH4-25]|uniref:metallophosphoesterase n=1 Tax=Xanthomarina sp. GH4-25 TaxID=3349335 RepID=UPI0038779625